MAIIFQWDRRKALSNAAKHGVTFTEAATAFADPFSVTAPDQRHSVDGDRFVVFWQSNRCRLVAVMFTARRGTIRIISACLMTPRERRKYEGGGEYDA